MEDEYEVLDTLTGFSIEPGDLIRTADGLEIVVHEIDHVDDGYEIRYYDVWADEYDNVLIGEDEFVELLG